ncbi:unnamed protein product [Ilex paraguariensis]|uniref:Uncharacterized protein n=1 Tax=Ilex paraguariensis TaxID=185542 RepID=A0ABC8QYF6_9AQUA
MPLNNLPEFYRAEGQSSSVENIDRDILSCGIEKLTSGGGGCSDYSVMDCLIGRRIEMGVSSKNSKKSVKMIKEAKLTGNGDSDREQSSRCRSMDCNSRSSSDDSNK